MWGVFGSRALEEVLKTIFFLLRYRTPAWYKKSVAELSTAAAEWLTRQLAGPELSSFEKLRVRSPKKSWSGSLALRESLVNESVRESLPVVPRKKSFNAATHRNNRIHFGPIKEPLIVSHAN